MVWSNIPKADDTWDGDTADPATNIFIPDRTLLSKRTVTDDTDITANDAMVLVDCRSKGADVTVTLPFLSAITEGQVFTLSKLEEDNSDFIAKFQTQGADTYATGATETDLVVFGESMRIMKDGTVYRKIGA